MRLTIIIHKAIADSQKQSSINFRTTIRHYFMLVALLFAVVGVKAQTQTVEYTISPSTGRLIPNGESRFAATSTSEQECLKLKSVFFTA